MAKKICALLLSVILVFSLTACSLVDKIKNDKKSTEESINKETTTQEQLGEINPVETSLETPAKIGDWIETQKYSSVDSTYHTAYYRITKILRYNDEVQKKISEYNSSEHTTYFSTIDNGDIEYCMLEYEVYFPEDFPAESEGIASASIDFNITTSSGDIVQVGDKQYTNLNRVFDITQDPEVDELHAGSLFTGGVAVFSMVKDYSDYIIKSYYLSNNQIIYSFIKGK